MGIAANGHTASWEEKEHPGELVFVIVQEGIVSLAKQAWVVDRAYSDLHDDRHEFGDDWTLVYIREPGRDALDLAKLEVVDGGTTDDSGLTAWRLEVTNLVTYKVHKFGLE